MANDSSDGRISEIERAISQMVAVLTWAQSAQRAADLKVQRLGNHLVSLGFDRADVRTLVRHTHLAVNDGSQQADEWVMDGASWLVECQSKRRTQSD